MDAAAPQTDESPQPCACSDCAALSEQAAHQLAVLRELTELGMRLARALCDEVETGKQDGAEPRRAADPALMFSRISRAVRQTLALEAKVLEDARTIEVRRIDHATERKAEAVRQHQAKRDAGIARKETVFSTVEVMIDFDAPETEIEVLLDRLEDLRDPADDARFADAPLSVWIAAICKDLGLAPNWELFADEDWAALEAVTWPDSPFAKLAPADPPPLGEGDREAVEGAQAHEPLNRETHPPPSG